MTTIERELREELIIIDPVRMHWYVYDWEDHPGNSFWDPSSRYEDPLDIQLPREIRLGVKFSW